MHRKWPVLKCRSIESEKWWSVCVWWLVVFIYSLCSFFLTHSHTTDNKSTQSQKLNLCRWQDKMFVSLELVSPHFLAHSLAGNFSVDEMMITMNYGRTRNTFSKTFSWILIKLFKPFFMHAIMNSVLLLGTLLISTQFSQRCVCFFLLGKSNRNNFSTRSSRCAHTGICFLFSANRNEWFLDLSRSR